ncbi:MAG: hypothetical protein QW424_04215 [Candidatus Bathyarchaeia archaeon]
MQHKAREIRARKLLDKVILIDSNILLEVKLAGSHADICKHFLRKVRDGVIKSVIIDFAGGM